MDKDVQNLEPTKVVEPSLVELGKNVNPGTICIDEPNKNAELGKEKKEQMEIREMKRLPDFLRKKRFVPEKRRWTKKPKRKQSQPKKFFWSSPKPRLQFVVVPLEKKPVIQPSERTVSRQDPKSLG